ncbi:hypothetical protein CW3_4908, partial [Bacteroides xylanisolvens SD CC 1b]
GVIVLLSESQMEEIKNNWDDFKKHPSVSNQSSQCFESIFPMF